MIYEVCNGLLSLPHVGLQDLPEAEKGGIVLLGVPIDVGTVTVPGSRFLPSYAREFGRQHQWLTDNGVLFGLFSPSTQTFRYRGSPIFDLGDAISVRDSVMHTKEEIYARVEAIGRSLSNQERRPISIGGDHAITVPLLRGLLARPAQVVVFDAHVDFETLLDADGLDYKILCHNNILNFLTYAANVDRVICVGARESGIAVLEGSRVTVIAPDGDPIGALGAILEHAGHPREAYVSFDVDVLDPSFIASVGAPSPGGLAPADVHHAFEAIGRHCRIVGADIVEFCVDRATRRDEYLVVEDILIRLLLTMHASKGG